MLSFALDLKPLQKGLANFQKDVVKRIPKALEKVAEQIRIDSKDKVPQDTRELVNSWTVEKKNNLTLQAGYDIVYAMYQHQGRRADGTHIIRNRPAGGQSFFLKSTIDTNLQKYFDLFEKEIFKGF